MMLFCGLCTVCHGLFALPLSVIGRLRPVIVATPRHLLYCFMVYFYNRSLLLCRIGELQLVLVPCGGGRTPPRTLP